MISFASRRSEADERNKNEIEDLSAGLAKINGTKVAFLENLCVQLIIRQGRVELDMLVPVYDFTGSILIHRRYYCGYGFMVKDVFSTPCFPRHPLSLARSLLLLLL